jgi:hypothetical protein
MNLARGRGPPRRIRGFNCLSAVEACTQAAFSDVPLGATEATLYICIPMSGTARSFPWTTKPSSLIVKDVSTRECQRTLSRSSAAIWTCH